jgi:hypothetical protein
MKNNLCIKVNLTEMNKFKATINIFKEILEDKNIDEEIRNKYKQRLLEIFDASEKR